MTRCSCTPIRAAIMIAAGTVVGTPATAHQQLRFWGAGSTATVDGASATTSSVTDLNGIVLGIEGQLAIGPVKLYVGYTEGDLDPNEGAGTGHRHVEGLVLLGGTPLTGLDLHGGPRLRSLVRPPGNERWLVWQLGAQYESPALIPWVRGVVQGWVGVAGDVSGVREFGSGRGGSVGMLVRPSSGPLEIRVYYAIDELRAENGAGRETLERLTLALGYRNR